MKIALHPAEILLNKLARAERKRSGDLMTRQKAEFDILVAALQEAEERGFRRAYQPSRDYAIARANQGSYD
jgi:hypothetical protein